MPTRPGCVHVDMVTVINMDPSYSFEAQQSGLFHSRVIAFLCDYLEVCSLSAVGNRGNAFNLNKKVAWQLPNLISRTRGLWIRQCRFVNLVDC